MAESERSPLIVVGSGIAGLSAALAGFEAGLDVTVIERATRAESGGNTRYTEAYLRMKSIDEVADDFVDALLGDFMGYPDPSLLADLHRDWTDWPPNLKALALADPQLVGRFADEAGPTLRWLTTFGVRFDEIVTQFLTTSTSRMAPRGGGLALIEALAAAAHERGVRFEYQTTARSLVTAEDGSVAGVRVKGRDGSATFHGQVVLACGGFEGNSEMLARYVGESGLHVRPVCRGGYYNKGEGIQMALDFGAAPGGNFGMFHAEPIDPRSGLSEPSIMIFPYGVLVNKQGERFVDEAPGPVDAYYERVTRSLHHQADGIGYVILDAKLDDVPNHKTAIRTDRRPVTADSLPELARQLGLPGQDFVKSITAYNEGCRDAAGFDPTVADGLATEGVRPAKSNWARPIDVPPFQAYPIISANVFTYGGLRVDDAARVIDTDGRVIPGLFAAGETVGLYFTNYAGSTSVLKGAVFGRLAGRAAAGDD
jgi:tricarballylate dehydrogenase